MKTYEKSKIKVIALVITVILIFVGSFCFLIIHLNTTIKITFTGTILVGLIMGVSQSKIQLFQKIIIESDSFLFINCYDKIHKPPVQLKIPFKDITELKYHGTKYIPINEIMIVTDGTETVYLDFNFENYLLLWEDIYLKCIEVNQNLKVDDNLKKRLKNCNNYTLKQ